MSEQENKGKFIKIAIVVIILIAIFGYVHYEENSIGGRFSVIKKLKMSDIAGAKN